MKKIILSLAMMAVAKSGHALNDPRIATMDLNAQQLAYYMAPGWNLGNLLKQAIKPIMIPIMVA